MDKCSNTVSFKVPPHADRELRELAAKKGITVSQMCRNWIFKNLHESKFRMEDYLSVDDESQ